MCHFQNAICQQPLRGRVEDSYTEVCGFRRCLTLREHREGKFRFSQLDEPGDTKMSLSLVLFLRRLRDVSLNHETRGKSLCRVARKISPLHFSVWRLYYANKYRGQVNYKRQWEVLE